MEASLESELMDSAFFYRSVYNFQMPGFQRIWYCHRHRRDLVTNVQIDDKQIQAYQFWGQPNVIAK